MRRAFWLAVSLLALPAAARGTECGDYGVILPWRVGGADTPGSAEGVAVAGSFAYVADRASLQVVDIADPAAPAIAASLPIYQATAVALTGDLACVAGGLGVDLVDVSNLSTPFVTGHLDTPGVAMGVAIAGAYP